MKVIITFPSGCMFRVVSNKWPRWTSRQDMAGSERSKKNRSYIRIHHQKEINMKLKEEWEDTHFTITITKSRVHEILDSAILLKALKIYWKESKVRKSLKLG